MKNFLAFLFTMLMFITSFAQHRNYDQAQRSRVYDDYMAKSHRLKTAGWILLGSGVGMLTAGVILIASDPNTYNNNNNYYNNNSLTTQQTVGAIFVYVGTLCSLGSIPLLVVGGVMHKKAMAASAFLEMEKVPGAKLTGIPLQPFPALGFRINL